MSRNLFVSYDLHEPGKNYEVVASEIKKLGAWAKVHYSFWYVNSTLTAEEAAKRVWAVMDSNDSLLVVNATDNHCYWYNLNNQVSDFIKSHWRVLV